MEPSGSVQDIVGDVQPSTKIVENSSSDERPINMSFFCTTVGNRVEDVQQQSYMGESQLRNDKTRLSVAIQAPVDNDQFPVNVAETTRIIYNATDGGQPTGDGLTAAAEERDAPDNGEVGMTVQDDVMRPPMKFCIHSVSHLPPLVTNTEKDAMSEHLLANFLESGALPDADLRLQLIQHIQRQKVNALCCNNFAEVRRLHKILQNFQDVLLRVRAQELHEERLEMLEAKRRCAAERLAQFRDKTAEIIHQEEQRQALRQHHLVRQHAEELQMFEDHWNDADYLRRFSKPSPHLLELTKIERSLVLAKDLEQAEIYHAMVVRRENAESEAAQRRMEVQMRDQQKKIIARHEAEVIALKEQGTKNIELLVSQREQQARGMIVQLQIAESELNAARATKLPGVPPMRPSESALEDGSMTKRTLQRYAEFKTNVKQPRVIVRPPGPIKMKKPRKPFEAAFMGCPAHS
jgi:hypothetical protein